MTSADLTTEQPQFVDSIVAQKKGTSLGDKFFLIDKEEFRLLMLDIKPLDDRTSLIVTNNIGPPYPPYAVSSATAHPNPFLPASLSQNSKSKQGR